MSEIVIKRLSIDLSNRCNKQCDFCYNSSNRHGEERWKSHEVINMVMDCVANGLEAVSFGGGEPFEYESIFEIISALTPHLFVSVTSNGIPLRESSVWAKLLQYKPDKIHITIHDPQNTEEAYMALQLVLQLRKEDIRSGINLLVSADKMKETKRMFQLLERRGISRQEIILIPRKYSLQPTTQELSEIAGNQPFQSASCLTMCQKSHCFASISWDKQINFCSYSPSRVPLQEFSYKGNGEV